MKTAVWFKTDLRLDDNEALLSNCSERKVTTVYCFDDSHCKLSYGFNKTGPFSSVLLESTDLDKNLRKLGSGLLIVKETRIEILNLP
jgi:deoxyribodipyrimidine photolyase